MPTKDQLFQTSDSILFEEKKRKFTSATSDLDVMAAAFSDGELSEPHRLKIEHKNIVFSNLYYNHEFLQNSYTCKITLPNEVIVHPESNSNDRALIILPAMEFSSISAAMAAWHITDLEERKKIKAKTDGLYVSTYERTRYIYDRPLCYGKYRIANYDEYKALMDNFLRQKYGPNNPELLEKLFETKDDLILIDGHLIDRGYQYGFDIYKKHGANLTGRMTMNIREEFKAKGLEVS